MLKAFFIIITVSSCLPRCSNKVAIRVRPFTQREKQSGAKLVVSMDGNTTTIVEPSGSKESKTFAFDYSYWSHDGYDTDENGAYVPSSSRYVDQRKIFNDLGIGVVTNAFEGYNACLLAYGQTGLNVNVHVCLCQSRICLID